MARIRFSLREIHIIKAGDGWLFKNGVDLYPCIQFNGSTEQKNIFGPKHDGLKSVGGHPFNDLWLEVEIPEGEFAYLTVTYFESDNNDEAAQNLKSTAVEKLSSYSLGQENLFKGHEMVRSGIDDNGKAWLETYDDSDQADALFFVALLATLLNIATGSNKDDYCGSWSTRIEVLPEGVFVATKGFGPGSDVDTSVIPPIVKLEEKTETTIPKMVYWVHNKTHLGYSLVAQQID